MILKIQQEGLFWFKDGIFTALMFQKLDDQAGLALCAQLQSTKLELGFGKKQDKTHFVLGLNLL